jgi:putative NADH-flavin reductase
VTHGIETIHRTTAAEFVMRLLIIGATGGTGLRVTSQAVERGHRVTAFVRSPQKLGSLLDRVAVHEGDPRNVAELQAILHCHDAVISALGPPGVGPTTILRDAARSTVAAMQAMGLHRLIVVSAAVLFDDLGIAGRFLRRTLLRNVGDDSIEMERIVVASGLDWTIARPPRLTNGPRTGHYDVENGHPPGRSAFASISRADVADFLLGEIQHNAHIHEIVGITAGNGAHR